MIIALLDLLCLNSGFSGCFMFWPWTFFNTCIAWFQMFTNLVLLLLVLNPSQSLNLCFSKTPAFQENPNTVFALLCFLHKLNLLCKLVIQWLLFCISGSVFDILCGYCAHCGLIFLHFENKFWLTIGKFTVLVAYKIAYSPKRAICPKQGALKNVPHDVTIT